MKNQEIIALQELALIIVKNKRGITNLINEQGLGSLTYDAPLSEVNKIVLNNLQNDAFVKALPSVTNQEYYNLDPVSWVVIGIIVVSTAYKVGWDAKNRREIEKILYRDEARTRYLSQKELDRIALINRQAMQKLILDTQQEYMQQKENMDAMHHEQKKKNALLIVVAGAICVAIIGRQFLR
tara:strand:- start:7 stop:552 length:546 start_codon:yes stop_codon:yes gene_type:complete